MNQSSQGTKAPKAHDAVPVFCEHPLKILNTKTIKFWYSERQLVSVPKSPKVSAWTGYRKKIKGLKGMLAQGIAGLTTQINVSLHPCLRG